MRGGRYALLIVDDERDVVEGLQRTLRHENYQMVTTTSPLGALDELDRGGIDVIISDIDMPEMSGLEVMARARLHHPAVVRILLTGDASLDSALEAINGAAVHRYLTKPWSTQGLREALRAAVVSIETLRQEASALRSADVDATRRTELERRHPGLSSVGRIEGAYLLNDARVVEELASLGPAGAGFAAARWLPLSGDQTTKELERP